MRCSFLKQSLLSLKELFNVRENYYRFLSNVKYDVYLTDCTLIPAESLREGEESFPSKAWSSSSITWQNIFNENIRDHEILKVLYLYF